MQNTSISPQDDQVNYVYYYASGSSYTSTQSLVNFSKSFSFSGFGNNDPRWKKAYNAGTYTIDFNSRPHGTKSSTESYYFQPSVQRTWTGNLDGQVQPTWLNTSLPALGFSDTVYNNAVTKLYDQIKDTELNLALTIGERKETYKMVQNAARSLGRIYTLAKKVRREVGNALVRRDKKYFQRISRAVKGNPDVYEMMHSPSKAIAGAWLSYKYGWLPLYSDVHALMEFSTRRFDLREFKARASRTDNKIDRALLASPSVWKVETILDRHTALIIVKAKVRDSNAFDLSRVTSMNPLSIAWELVPFSFVVDWFVDVGGYLANMEAALGAGLDFHSGMVTRVNVQKSSIEIYGTETGGYYPTSFTTSYNVKPRVVYRVLKTRTLLSGFPRPELPSFKVSLGSQRIMSAASLIRTVLLGKF